MKKIEKTIKTAKKATEKLLKNQYFGNNELKAMIENLDVMSREIAADLDESMLLKEKFNAAIQALQGKKKELKDYIKEIEQVVEKEKSLLKKAKIKAKKAE
jgi:DNA mismatch repair ATPase MutS